jgi:hypothetical protein
MIAAGATNQGTAGMADDVLEDAGPAPDAGKVKRAPPTIDLEATKVSETATESKAADADPAQADLGKEDLGKADGAAEPPHPQDPEPASADASASGSPPVSRPVSPWVIAPFSGAAAASLVILVGWLLGWPQVQTPVQAPSAVPQASAAAVDDLGKRVAALEAKLGKPATDPAVTARLDATEKSAAALRGDVADLRAQSDKLAAALNEARSAAQSAGAAAPAVDLSAINARIDQIERTNRAQSAAIAQTDEKVASKPADDLPLRRVVAAALLDVAVRHGDPFAGALAAAKALAPEPDKLKPLEPFADKGVPGQPALMRELLTLVPKLSPAAEAPAGGSIVDRLQAGASKLVRIERTDSVGSDRSAIVARVTADALRNDFADARRELASLDAADRAPAQAWLDKVAARDAALASSRQFADDTMSGLAKSVQ